MVILYMSNDTIVFSYISINTISTALTVNRTQLLSPYKSLNHYTEKAVGTGKHWLLSRESKEVKLRKRPHLKKTGLGVPGRETIVADRKCEAVLDF